MDEQKLPDILPEEASAPEAAPETDSAPARDYAAEAAELLKLRPALRGQPLPDAVARAAVEQGVPLLQAYLDHELREANAEAARLREENRVYRQNAEAARRSPVQGVAGSGGDDTAGDPFLAGFSGAGW
jgi:hypothetical protein